MQVVESLNSPQGSTRVLKVCFNHIGMSLLGIQPGAILCKMALHGLANRLLEASSRCQSGWQRSRDDCFLKLAIVACIFGVLCK